MPEHLGLSGDLSFCLELSVISEAEKGEANSAIFGGGVSRFGPHDHRLDRGEDRHVSVTVM